MVSFSEMENCFLKQLLGKCFSFSVTSCSVATQSSLSAIMSFYSQFKRCSLVWITGILLMSLVFYQFPVRADVINSVSTLQRRFSSESLFLTSQIFLSQQSNQQQDDR